MNGPKIQLPSPDEMAPGTVPFLNSVQLAIFAATRNGPTADRPTSSMAGRFEGMPYFDTTLGLPVYLKYATSNIWVRYDGDYRMTPGQDRVTSKLSADWATTAVAPFLGEVCFELNTGKYKYGNGTSTYAQLSYPSGSGASTAAWGDITGTLSDQTDLQTALNAKAYTSTLAVVATTGVYADLTGKPTLGTSASTAASTYAIAASSYAYVSSYVYQSQIGTVASTFASTWAIAASSYAYSSNYVYQSQVGTAASTAASTWAIAATTYAYASTYVYQAQLGTAASTNASIYASSTHAHDATQITSGVFSTSRIASTGTASSNTVLYGDQRWSTLPAGGAGTVTSVAVSSAITGMSIAGSPITNAGTITLNTSGLFATQSLASTGTADATTFLRGDRAWAVPVAGSGTVTSVAVSTTVLGLTISGSPITTQGTTTIGGYAAHSLVSSAPLSTIALGINTYSTAASVSLVAGSWLLNGVMLIGSNVASSVRFTGRLAAGSQNLSTIQEGISPNVSTYCTLTASAVLVNGGTTTVTWAGAADVVNCFIRQQAWQNAAGSTGTFLTAVRFA